MLEVSSPEQGAHSSYLASEPSEPIRSSKISVTTGAVVPDAEWWQLSRLRKQAKKA